MIISVNHVSLKFSVLFIDCVLFSTWWLACNAGNKKTNVMTCSYTASLPVKMCFSFMVTPTVVMTTPAESVLTLRLSRIQMKMIKVFEPQDQNWFISSAVYLMHPVGPIQLMALVQVCTIMASLPTEVHVWSLVADSNTIYRAFSCFHHPRMPMKLPIALFANSFNGRIYNL